MFADIIEDLFNFKNLGDLLKAFSFSNINSIWHSQPILFEQLFGFLSENRNRTELDFIQ